MDNLLSWFSLNSCTQSLNMVPELQVSKCCAKLPQLHNEMKHIHIQIYSIHIGSCLNIASHWIVKVNRVPVIQMNRLFTHCNVLYLLSLAHEPANLFAIQRFVEFMAARRQGTSRVLEKNNQIIETTTIILTPEHIGNEFTPENECLEHDFFFIFGIRPIFRGELAVGFRDSTLLGLHPGKPTAGT